MNLNTALYSGSVADALSLPDLPYGGMAHFAHMGVALYDTGRTFQNLWNEPELKHNITKIITHPEMAETLIHRGTMLTVMGLLHPLGPVIAIGVAYLCAHLVHSAFQLLENNKNVVRDMDKIPVLKSIYIATGIKEWAEKPLRTTEDSGSIADLDTPQTHVQASQNIIPAERLQLESQNTLS